MKGRLRNAWMRWARRVGRRERVKLAESKSADSERGGRPCLDDEIRDVSRAVRKLLPDEVRKRQRMQWSRSETGDLVVVDGGCSRERRRGRISRRRRSRRSCQMS